MRALTLLVLPVVVLLPTLMWVGDAGVARAATGGPGEKLRLIVETDAPGGDPDDEGSLVRFLLYCNEWDVEAMLATRPREKSRTGYDGEEAVRRHVRAYGKVYEKLKLHSKGYPSAERLLSRVAPSYAGTRGRDLVLSAIDADDRRPVWYVNWGTEGRLPTAMRQALDHVKLTRSPEEYSRFTSKIALSRDGSRHLAGHVRRVLFWVDTRNPDRWYRRFAPLTARAGGFDVRRDVKTGHGPLGALYTIQKEGDTPGFLYLVPVGLCDPFHPTWGSWGGRFSSRDDEYAGEKYFWSRARDTWGGNTSRDNTLRRWALHLQNDFKARMDWCVKDYAQANHPPAPCINGAKGMGHIAVEAKPGEGVALSAKGSTDPDGDGLSYEWVYYPEPGTYGGEVSLTDPGGRETTVKVPGDADGKTIHIVLIVTDDGEPALTRYRRAVIRYRRSG